MTREHYEQILRDMQNMTMEEKEKYLESVIPHIDTDMNGYCDEIIDTYNRIKKRNRNNGL